MVQVYLIRHGHVDYEPPARITADNPLSPLGHQMAERLAERCAEFDLQLLVTSTMRRARETGAAITARCPDLPVIEMPEFGEVNVRDLEDYAGDPADEDMHLWTDDHFRHGNEQMWQRVTVGWERLQEIVREQELERIAIVAHGGSLNALIRHILGQSPVRLMDAWFDMDYTAVSCIRYEGDRHWIMWLNDARHVEDLAPVRQEWE